VEDALKWESMDLIHDDETEYLQKMTRSYRLKRPNFKPEELFKMTPIMIKKCYNTIEMIYKEILTEKYWRIEYD